MAVLSPHRALPLTIILALVLVLVGCGSRQAPALPSPLQAPQQTEVAARLQQSLAERFEPTPVGAAVLEQGTGTIARSTTRPTAASARRPSFRVRPRRGFS